MEFEDIQSFRKVKDSGVFDPMTGLYNKQAITDYAHEMVEHPGKGFYFSLLDIDHFKHVNDTYGHESGDQILTTIAQCIQANVREQDFCLRWGGEEFVILLNGCDLPAARSKVERLRKSIESNPTEFFNKKILY